MTTDLGVLLSVRPRFASALLDGSKTVEVRRRRAHIADGTLCLLYASSPTCALVGALRVATTDIGSAEALWSRYGDAMGVARQEYERYLDGAAQPCAIVVAATASFPQPVRLPELRRRSRAFVAPQSYRFLRGQEAQSLLNGQHQQLVHIAATPTNGRTDVHAQYTEPAKRGRPNSPKTPKAPR